MNEQLKQQLANHAAEIRALALPHPDHATLLVTLGDLIDAVADAPGHADESKNDQNNNHAASSGMLKKSMGNTGGVNLVPACKI